MNLPDLLLGRRLANRESGERKIGAIAGVPAMGLDAIASSAYGPEAAFTVLLPLGAAGLGWISWVMAPVIALLGILFASYWQTLRAYPTNGGGYVVARENLGTGASLVAAAALMVDYVLNVAVGISAGVGALVSAVPSLHPHTLALCLAILALLTLVNLRGTWDAGRLFAVPTYLFIVCFAAIIGIGVWKTALAGGHPQPLVPPAPLPAATATASAWLLVRAFASGCAAMTGVEAVSNGMGAFRPPAVRHGHRTLAIIVLTLGGLLAGTIHLARAYGIGAMDQTQAGYRSVLAQLAGVVAGDGPFYFTAMASLLAVLALSANTSFVAFPCLCRMVAEDGFLPRPFAQAGRRLVFSVGILYLAASAGVLLLVFGGITDRLIPLFAIGTFLTFTLSQAGMVRHWLRERAAQEGGRHALPLCISAAGAAICAVVAVVMMVAKFTAGAWIVLLAIPCVIGLLRAVRGYYDALDARMREQGPLDLAGVRPPLVLLVMEEWNRLTDKALGFALGLSADVMAVHLAQLAGPDSEQRHLALGRQWERDVEGPARAAGFDPPPLRILDAPYRTMHEPLLRLVGELSAARPGQRIAVLIPELVKQHWYQHVLHGRRARRLRAMLLRHGGPQLIVISVPWHLERPLASVADCAAAE